MRPLRLGSSLELEIHSTSFAARASMSAILFVSSCTACVGLSPALCLGAPGTRGACSSCGAAQNTGVGGGGGSGPSSGPVTFGGGAFSGYGGGFGFGTFGLGEYGSSSIFAFGFCFFAMLAN